MKSSKMIDWKSTRKCYFVTVVMVVVMAYGLVSFHHRQLNSTEYKRHPGKAVGIGVKTAPKLGKEILAMKDTSKRLLHKSIDSVSVSTNSRQQYYSGDVKTAIETEHSQNNTIQELRIGNQTFTPGIKAIGRIISISRKIANQHSFVTLQFLNRGYLNITKSWICNVQCMGMLSKTLFIASDEDSLDGLARWNREIQVLPLFLNTFSMLSCGKVAFYKFVLFRSWIILLLLQHNIQVLTIESDAVWLDDPMPMISSYFGWDIISVSNDLTGTGISTGFIYFNTTQSTKDTWQDVVARLEQYIKKHPDDYEKMSAHSSEMQTLKRLLQERNLLVKTLPHRNFVSGLWYQNSTLRMMTDPIVIQNNWIIGNENKINRAKAMGHWYLTDEGDCKDDNELVKCP